MDIQNTWGDSRAELYMQRSAACTEMFDSSLSLLSYCSKNASWAIIALTKAGNQRGPINEGKQFRISKYLRA